MSTFYRPGTSIAIVGATRTLLIAADVDVAATQAAFDKGLASLMDHLLASGIAGLPEFASWEVHGDRLRVIMRGSYAAQAAGDAWDAVGAATWIERVMPLPDGDVVIGRVGASEARLWPLAAGVVLADEVVARPDGSALESPIGAVTGTPEGRPNVHAAAAPAGPALAESPASQSEAILEVAASESPAVEPEAPAADAVDVVGDVATDVVPGPVPAPEPEAGSAAEAAVGIASIAETAQPVAEAAPTMTEAVDDSFDDLFGHTVIRTAEDAAVRVDEARPLISAVPGMSAHPPVEELPEIVSPPIRLEFSSGRVVEMDRTVIVGLNPVARNSVGAVPCLVPVDSPNKVISRTHLELALEDGRVVAKDVSSNGTLLTRPGADPQRLPAGQQVLLTDGCLLELGDDVSILVVTG